MNLGHTFRKYQQKYYASGSPLRHVRKAALTLSQRGANRLRSRVGAQLTQDLPAHLAKRVADLETTGYADAGDEIDPLLLAELLQATKSKLAAGSEAVKTASFFSSLTAEEDLRSDSIYVRFALQPAVQKLACAYFHNTVPYLTSATLLLSTGHEAKQWINSQLWHLDYTDNRTLRFWVYLSDVLDNEGGPFTYLPVGPSEKVPNTFFPGRVTDEQMDAAGLSSAACRVYGPKGKAFFIDTSRCYHLGSRLKAGHRRLVFDATFITHQPLYPCQNEIRPQGELSEIDKCFLTL